MSHVWGGWLFIGVSFISVLAFWKFTCYVLDILGIYIDHYRAAKKREAPTPHKEKERSSSWQRFSS